MCPQPEVLLMQAVCIQTYSCNETPYHVNTNKPLHTSFVNTNKPLHTSSSGFEDDQYGHQVGRKEDKSLWYMITADEPFCCGPGLLAGFLPLKEV